METIQVFSDGSFTKTNAIWGFIACSKDGTELFRNRGMLKGKINMLWQIGGEIFGVTEGIRYCKLNNYKADFVVDYVGLLMWIADMLEIGKPWKCKNEFTTEYRNFMLENKQYLNSMTLVRGHGNCAGNNAVDAYCSALWHTKKDEKE
jgi:hypothetical protein